jgi:hypothetical protein
MSAVSLNRASVKIQAVDKNYNSIRSSRNMNKHFYAYDIHTLVYISSVASVYLFWAISGVCALKLVRMLINYLDVLQNTFILNQRLKLVRILINYLYVLLNTVILNQSHNLNKCCSKFSTLREPLNLFLRYNTEIVSYICL